MLSHHAGTASGFFFSSFRLFPGRPRLGHGSLERGFRTSRAERSWYREGKAVGWRMRRPVDIAAEKQTDRKAVNRYLEALKH